MQKLVLILLNKIIGDHVAVANYRRSKPEITVLWMTVWEREKNGLIWMELLSSSLLHRHFEAANY